ncbi:hypothetical protein P6P35_16085, partial [Clostridium perfringens]|nr:hypothetical protein [Clostridium perfringens]
MRDRSNLPNSARKISYISPEEICIGIEKVVKELIAIQPEATIPYIAKMFGFARVTDDIKKEIMSAINLSIKNKKVFLDGEYLK